MWRFVVRGPSSRLDERCIQVTRESTLVTKDFELKSVPLLPRECLNASFNDVWNRSCEVCNALSLPDPSPHVRCSLCVPFDQMMCCPDNHSKLSLPRPRFWGRSLLLPNTPPARRNGICFRGKSHKTKPTFGAVISACAANMGFTSLRRRLEKRVDVERRDGKSDGIRRTSEKNGSSVIYGIWRMSSLVKFDGVGEGKGLNLSTPYTLSN